MNPARNNADWCDLVCRSHGIGTARDEAAWVALRRSPPFYPDAVTLHEATRAGDMLVWSAVGTPDELREWAAAHSGGPVFHPSLLADPAVAILAGRAGDELVAGAIGNQSADVVGISNVFTTRDVESVWAEAAAAVSARFPGVALVGYERDAELRAARRAGFASVGALRVWLAG